jgi:hypothetical protein
VEIIPFKNVNGSSQGGLTALPNEQQATIELGNQSCTNKSILKFGGLDSSPPLAGYRRERSDGNLRPHGEIEQIVEEDSHGIMEGKRGGSTK